MYEHELIGYISPFFKQCSWSCTFPRPLIKSMLAMTINNTAFLKTYAYLYYIQDYTHSIIEIECGWVYYCGREGGYVLVLLLISISLVFFKLT